MRRRRRRRRTSGFDMKAWWKIKPHGDAIFQMFLSLLCLEVQRVTFALIYDFYLGESLT